MLRIRMYIILLTTFLLSDVCADGTHRPTKRPDGHAPIGVMGDHTHQKGEWMASYRYMVMNMDGHRQGDNKLDSAEVFQRGFSSAAKEMKMIMHMVGLMYAPTDSLTLMVMANYIENDMTMMSNPMSAHHGNGHDSHSVHGTTVNHTHSSRGLGDMKLSGLLSLWQGETQRLHAGVGLSIPTGSVDEKENRYFLPYGMQLGSGTHDALLSLTYLGQTDRWSWGAQLGGEFRLEDEGDSGFTLGDKTRVTSWIARTLTDMFSASFRLNYTSQDTIDGHYNGPHNHSAPPHFQANYGGDILHAVFGLNLLFTEGRLKGHRLAMEYSRPVSQNINGVGMNYEDTLILGWQFAW